MDSGPYLNFETGSTPLDWVLRIVPSALAFFGLAWCMWTLHRIYTHNHEDDQRIQQQLTEPKDPVDKAKRRAWIETKLVTRKVLPRSPDGTIVFSEPIQSSSQETLEVWSNSDETETTSNNITSLCEDEEQALPQKRNEQQSEVSLNDDDQSRDHDLNLSKYSLLQMRPSSLKSIVSNYFEIDCDTECCQICLTEYCEGDVVCWSPNEECVHAFHKECMLDWTVRNPRCPVCRINYL